MRAIALVLALIATPALADVPGQRIRLHGIDVPIRADMRCGGLANEDRP